MFTQANSNEQEMQEYKTSSAKVEVLKSGVDLAEYLERNNPAPTTLEKLVETALIERNFNHFKTLISYNNNIPLPPITEKTRINISMTLLNAVTAADWKFACEFLDVLPMDYCTPDFIVLFICQGFNSECDEENLCLSKLQNLNTSLLDQIGLAALKAKKDKFIVKFLENYPFSEETREKILVDAWLFSDDLTQYIKLSAYNLKVTDLKIPEANNTIDFDVNQLRAGSSCDVRFPAYSFYNSDEWRNGIIKKKVGDWVYFFSEGYNYNLVEWINIAQDSYRFAKAGTFSKSPPVHVLNLKKLIERISYKANTTAEYEFVCQILEVLVGKIIFDASFFRLLFNNALQSNADEKILVRLIKLGAIITTAQCEILIEKNQFGVLKAIKEENIQDLLYRSVHASKCNIIKILLQYSLVKKEILPDLLSLAIIKSNFITCRDLVKYGASFSELKLDEIYDANQIAKQGIESGMTCWVPNKRQDDGWLSVIVLNRNSNAIFVDYGYCYDESGSSNRSAWISLTETIAFCRNFSELSNKKLGFYLKEVFLKASSAEDWDFVCEHLEELIDVDNDANYLSNLFLVALRSSISDEKVKLFLKFNFPLTSKHVGAAFAWSTKHKLELILNKDKAVSDNESLLYVSFCNKFMHIHAYLDARTVSKDTYVNLILKSYQDTSNNYFHLKSMLTRTEKSSEIQQAALIDCLENAVIKQQNILATMIYRYSGLIVSEALLLKEYARVDFWELYFNNVHSRALYAYLPKFIQHSLTDKGYSATLWALKKYHEVNPRSLEKSRLIKKLVEYCEDKINDEGKLISGSKSLFWNSSTDIPIEARFNAACKFVILLVSGDPDESQLTAYEMGVIKDSDLTNIIAVTENQEILPAEFQVTSNVPAP